MTTPAVQARAVCLSHRGPRGTVSAVRDASLEIAPGETVALAGRSGSGKTSLLMALGLLTTPDSGTIHIAGQDTSALNDTAASALRRDRIGFVFQSFNLLPQFTALENVTVAHRGGMRAGAEDARRLLEGVGLGHRLRHRPHELSAGEQQRVAIARALVNGPGLLLADEPTGNLDAGTESEVLDVLARQATEQGCAVLLVTHSSDVAARADRTLRMADGVLRPGNHEAPQEPQDDPHDPSQDDPAPASQETHP
ncbi:ABC transporter ATP-binding protein [Streptomyces halobius]|uniref:ABC transporter ATP-binding protein n=1 Tax=Streptomyces halobius TaxID=2879846 RepID=A0ABY4MAM0_9ACTN|nr:ABC transporter ATP-binding protein [Streptomyces halobius]UQA94819.1 ABC transporter ATP-binding protein [Streptomyces halobius]